MTSRPRLTAALAIASIAWFGPAWADAPLTICLDRAAAPAVAGRGPEVHNFDLDVARALGAGSAAKSQCNGSRAAWTVIIIQTGR